MNDKSKYILNIYEQKFQQNQQNMINININAPKIEHSKLIPKKNNSSNPQANTNIMGIYNLNSQTELRDIKQCFIYPPLIGLENLGNSSYMNTTLQFLFVILINLLIILNIIATL